MPKLIARHMLLASVAFIAGPATARAQADDWWRHITVLAHDSMRGRESGSPEHKKAATYVADQFRRAGLAPAGTNGYLQPVRFVSRTIDESKSSLVIIRDGRETPLVLGEDASFVLRAPLAEHVAAPVVFVGYGLQVPEYGIDDLEGLDLKGKIVAFLGGIPRGVPGPVVSHLRSQAWPVFRARGAVGMITFSGSLMVDSVFRHSALNRLVPQLTLADTALDNQIGNQLSISMNAARAQMLFAGALRQFAELAILSDSGRPLPHFELRVRIRATASTRVTPVTSDNVAGVFRGTDPQLRDEYIVVTAHLDHVGVGAAVKGDSIYNGAMDNASGTALLIETARALSTQRDSLRRSVIFVAVTAEEKGLLGSRYFANHPTVPENAIVANLNTDMFLPLMPFRMLMANGLEESNLADDARRVAAAAGVQVIPDPEPEENRFVRSDQYSFILRGVPALSLKVGFLRDTPEHTLVKTFRANRYHQPSDDLDQPIDRQAAADFGRLYVQLVKAVANRDTKPSWLESSYFKRFAR
jgi:hypothetical protein